MKPPGRGETHPEYPPYIAFRPDLVAHTTCPPGDSLKSIMLAFRALAAAAAFATLAAQTASAGNSTYSWCQYPKEQGLQLNGCPDGTVYVSQTDPQAEYGTVSIHCGHRRRAWTRGLPDYRSMKPLRACEAVLRTQAPSFQLTTATSSPFKSS
jgi:hypothetical protein